MRISELANLRWSDVDLNNRLITVKDETASRSRRGDRTRQTKGRRSRSFPIHAGLQATLERKHHASDGMVYHGPLGGELSPDVVRRSLIRNVLKPLATQFPSAAGEIGFQDGRVHSFRHYFCSTCANSGVPEQMVMHWLGHQESRMVRHYYHAHDDVAQTHMQRIQFVDSATATEAVGD